VKLVGGEFDAKAQKLADILEATNYRPLGVVLAPKEATKK
jgi:hypothetical protein